MKYRSFLLTFALMSCVASAETTYDVGGPLEGVVLPLYPTQHGEIPGFPGCLPGSTNFLAEGQCPEPYLYDGSVEHWRTYFQKYLPIKSLFDRQSLLHNWLAKDLASAAKAQVESYAEPVCWTPRFGNAVDTGKRNKPVPVVRCKPGSLAIRLDLGTLPPGLHALRVIGAVEASSLQRHRKPLLLRLTVNDGLNGEANAYPMRCGYVEEFYSVAEFYFHAPVQRAYQATFAFDESNEVELLVHNIDLHDALAGATRRAIKTRPTLGLKTSSAKPSANTEARLARDAMLWSQFPPVNAQQGYVFGGGGDDPPDNRPNFGAGGLSASEIEDKHGKWETDPSATPDAFLINKKLNLRYTMNDLRAHRPLPDPYPFKDNGTGVFSPSAKPGENPQNWIPVAEGVTRRVRELHWKLTPALAEYVNNGDVEQGRDAALMLIRYAYEYPSFDLANSMAAVMLQPGAYTRDLRCRRRETSFKEFQVAALLESYDQLFPMIQGNEDLAKSMQRFIPWVKNSSDLVQLLDVYLVQTYAKRYLRYQFNFNNRPADIVLPATVLGDSSVTDPWMAWLFNRTFVYPMPPSGLQDLMVTGNDRNGIGYIGSYYYAQIENAAGLGTELDKYIRAGGNPRFDLRDPKRFPKVHAACDWILDTRLAGLYFPRIGDVTAPDKPYGVWFNHVQDLARIGWSWTRQPKFAYVLKHFTPRKNETDAEWAEIEKAAATAKRAPWLDNHSQVLANWYGSLASGVEHDDFRFRRVAYLRVGIGYGHAHHDTLDLQLYAHGYPMMMDGGQRVGYSKPPDPSSRVHNLVEVDGESLDSHSWITALSDTDGARYMAADAATPTNHPDVTLYRRQVALIDVDEGGGAKPLSPTQLVSNAKLDPNVVTPNSYVFDVVRVSGGKTHTYCFHATVDDDLQTNLGSTQNWDTMSETDRAYLEKFPDKQRSFAGDAANLVQATWRFTRDGNGSEPKMAEGIWNPDSPRKFTRLHLFGHKGDRVLSGRLMCQFSNYSFHNVYVQKRSDQQTETVFPAIIEPFVGEAFVTGQRLIEIPGNDSGARRAVVVEVKTKNGRTDVCFADGQPDKTRGWRMEDGEWKIAGEFAYVSKDKDGLRQATITGGTLLSMPDVRLELAKRERSGKISRVDYLNKTMTIDSAWPALPGSVFEIGTTGHWTTYTVASTKGKSITVTEGADFYLSRVTAVDAGKGIVTCKLGLPIAGVTDHWVASNETMTKFWRADFLGGAREDASYQFRLSGASVAAGDFSEQVGLYLWEYGVGDQVRMATYASLRRVEPGRYQISANTALRLKLNGISKLRVSTDGKTWRELSSGKDGSFAFDGSDFGTGSFLIETANSN